ncbi:MAG: ABC transporter permease [Glaciimonas sp.]|nr:ABC transporter permease [Glaciimonas sp.]
MNTLFLALRNLLRNRRRSITTLLAMIIGLVAILIFGGYSANVIYGLQTGAVQRSGHLQIQRKDYFLYGSSTPAAYGIADYQRIIDLVKRDPVLAPMLAVVTPTLELGGIAGNFAAGVSRSVIATGVVAEERNRMFQWNDYGNTSYAKPLALSGTAQDAVVIGTGVARVLQLCGPLKVPDCRAAPAKPKAQGGQVPDDIAALSALEKSDIPAAGETRIEMLAANAHGAPNVASLNVVKAENVGYKEYDDVYLAMHLAQAQRLIFGAEPPQVTAIMLQLQHTSQMPAASARLEQLLATTFKTESLEVQKFETLNPIYGQSVAFMASVFTFIAALIGVIVLFTIGNTMSMTVVERTVEIGTLRAIGLRRSGIRRLFLCEALLLGVIGTAIGVLTALLMAFLINHSGLTWTPPGYVYAYPIKIRIWGDLQLLFGSAIGLTLVTLISAWWPANRASKMMIVDALRHV